MRIKTKTTGQKIADTTTIESFIAELRSSLVGKLFEGENGEPDTILLMQKYLDEGRGSSLEQILMGRAIAELVKLRQEMANLTNPSTCFKMGVMEELQDQVVALKEELLDTIEGAGVLQEKIEQLECVKEKANIRISEYIPPPVVREIPPPHAPYSTGDCTLSIENINKICREDEQNQLTEMIEGQSIANRYKSALEKLAQEETDKKVT